MPCCSGLLRGSDWAQATETDRVKQKRRTAPVLLRRFIKICVICGLVCQIDGERRNNQPEQTLYEEEKKSPEAHSFDPDRSAHI